MSQIIQWNEQLYGAPSGVLLAAFAIALGYLLKSLPKFNNQYIPFVVVSLCTIGFMLIAPARTPDMALRIWLVRNFIIGFIIGFAAWTFHAQLLRRFVDPKFFPDDNNQTPANPPAQPKQNT